MNIKKKFESIDQSQLSESQKEILGKIKTATKDFTITDEKALQKVDSALDNIIAKLEKTNPQAIKTEPKKQEPKAKKEVVKKEPKSETKKPKEPKKESGGKRTIFSIAKEIRKADESWEEAKKRAKKIMETEKEDTTKKMKSETDKLLAFIKRRKELEGLSGTSVKKDSKIEALPKGKRVSKKGWKNQYGESEGGKVYYENRDNRTDRLAPKFEDKIYLAEGGGVGNKLSAGVYRVGKPIKVRANLYAQKIAEVFDNGEIATATDYGKSLSDFKSMKYPIISKEKLESMYMYGGSFSDGGTIIGTPETPLARDLGMYYTGLVGETGAMSSGELFENGGEFMTDPNFGDFQNSVYAKGGGTKGYVEITNPKTQLFDKGYRIYGGDSWETLEDLKKSYAGRSLPKGAMIVKVKGGKVDYFAIAEKERFASGGYVVIAKSEKGGGFVMSKPSTKAKAEKLKSLLPKIDGETNEVMTITKASKLSGLVGKEYLKYADGGTIIGTPETPLARGLDMDYTTLVGETGAMSSGELFEGGGGIPNNYDGKTPSEIWNMYSTSQKYHFLSDHSKEIESTPMSVEKATKTAYRFLPEKIKKSFQKHIREGQYANGGRTRERKYVNYRQKHEVRYSKNKPHRRGYGYEDGGFMADVYAEGGQTIDAFQMRLVKGVDSKPSEVLTTEQEVKFATGGGVGKKKTQKELRNEYLEKLGSKEADVWDKIGAESGSEIRNDEKMLRAYAESVEEMLQKEGVGKGSFDQEDYDFYTGENWHLFNEFLVWNGYYEPEMTKTEKAWREDRFKDPKYRNYVSNPKIISLSGSSKPKSSKYIVNADIKEVKVKTDAGYEYTFKGTDVLNGVNILEKGSLLKNNATYVAKRNIIHVELKNGEKVKPANGYWIKKDAKGELFKPEKKEEYKVMSNQAIFPKRGVGTYWYVENSKGQTINNTTGKPYKGKEMTNYYFLNEEGAKKFAEKLNNSSFEGGGSTKRGGAMQLAKQIRKEGESWQSALKRANEQVRKK
jgi:hypothetical protein